MDISEFLEARISEDEARAGSGWSRLGDSRWETTNYGQDFLTPSAVLAECAAKRAIIEEAEEATGLDMSVDNDRRVGRRDEATEPYCGDVILSALAAVYRDHPDYRQEWAAKRDTPL
jgi:hypothetical protein